jgi:hypothetical protein
VGNLREDPRALVQLSDRSFAAGAREPAPGEESDVAHRALFLKYSAEKWGLTRWRDHGLLVALDLE